MTLPPGTYAPLDSAQMTPREFRALFAEFSAPSWRAWNAVEDAAFGFEPEDAALVRRLTGRTVLPSGQIAELWAVVGRGGGKSRFAARLACYMACGRVYRRVAGEHVFIGVFAPDRKQARLTLGYIRGLLRSVPALAALIEAETSESITLSNGVVIEVVTANTAAPRGRAYAVVIIEEAAFLTVDEHGADTDRELLRAVRPALARVPGSMLVVISSPYSMHGEVHRNVKERHGTDDPDVMVVVADTATMNLGFSRREIDRAFRDDPVAARSEYGRDGTVEFRTDVAEFFGPSLGGVVNTGVQELPPRRDRAPVFHMDTATGAGEDDAVLSGAWYDEDGRAVQVVLRRWSPPFSPLSVIEEASTVIVRYGASGVQVDRFAAGVFADMFAARGVTCAVAERDTSQMFIELLALVNSGRVRLLDDDVLLAQLRGLERRTRTGGRDSVGHRSRGHDDVAAASAGSLVLAAGAHAARCRYCDDAECDGQPPFGLVGSPAVTEWFRIHPDPDALARDTDLSPTAEQRDELLRLAEPWCAALEIDDEHAAATTWSKVEAFVGADGPLRDLAQRMRAQVEELRHV